MTAPARKSRSSAREIAEAPIVAAPALAEITRNLREARREIERRPIDEVLRVLASVADSWLSASSPWRERAEHILPKACGFSPQMVRLALPWMIEPLGASAIGDLLDRELGTRARLDRFAGGRRVRGPRLIVQVLSGNLPGLAAAPVATALALKSAVLVKTASGDRIFPALWSASIAALDPALGACARAVYWPGGDRECEAKAFEAAELVVASGGDAAIAELRSRSTGRFIGHGHKVSFALVGRETLDDPHLAHSAAAAIALDVAIWDQRGCLSPQLCFVEGDFASALRFAELLAPDLDRMAREVPPGKASLEENLAVRRFRDDIEWPQTGRPGGTLLAPKDSLDWSIAVEREPRFFPTPLRRSLRVLPIRGENELRAVLAPARRHLEAAGLAVVQSRRRAWSELLGSAGVHRVCDVGHMQRPSLAWAQGGRPRIADWVEWCIDDDSEQSR